jgi:ribosomal protein L11 methyltransferase
MPTWTAVTVTAAAELAEPLESFLLDCVAPGLQTEDVGGDVRITAHFAAAARWPSCGLHRALGGLVPHAAAPRQRRQRRRQRLGGERKAHFPPLAIGEHLFVHPPWVDTIPADRIGIVLDPGMAFGTGHHASTRGCLVLLERGLGAASGARVLDLGTGSGILAIAAAQLGAGEVWAVDVDPDACAIARQNARANQVDDALHIALDLAAVPGQFNVVLANLLAGLLIEHAGTIAARLRPRGLAIGAGLQLEEATAVRRAWRAAGLEDDGDYAEDGWAALGARRPS